MRQIGIFIGVSIAAVIFGASSPEGGVATAAPSELPAPPKTVGAESPKHDGVPTAILAPASASNANAGSATTPTLGPGSSVPESGVCPSDMVMVEGDYCPWLEQKCLRWVDPETKMRCAEFAPTGPCQSGTSHKKFCIDKFEYPNVAGERPVVMKTWVEAKATCESIGKRLCGETEWTLACEGEERMPYPYGLTRDAEACNIDKPHPEPDEKLIADPRTRDAEVARLDQRDPSGFREACVSSYGVHDMTGNVDEWVVNESGRPYKSGLKGGYWGPVRTRCRPMTTAHNETFIFYQIGFRCCADAPKADATAAATPKAAPEKAPAAAAAAPKAAPVVAAATFLAGT
ncbi:formylglycine-generating enzyme family protein [Pendulispora rubella]|uniref:Formylglycine-generating enzyme family protein n=1 Tax=Pendulispora rubella TaxID=2741070 RepID=A0ABZ2LKC2_9BACT